MKNRKKRNVIALTGLYFIAGILIFLLSGFDVFSENENDISSYYYFIRNFVAFTYVLSWTLWCSVFFWLYQIARNRASVNSLWTRVDKTFIRALLTFCSFSVGLILIGAIYTPQDFYNAMWSLSPVYAVFFLVVFTILFIFFLFCNFYKKNNPILKKSFFDVLKSVGCLLPTLLFVIIFISLREFSPPILSLSIFPLFLIVVPLFCGGPYVLISLYRTKPNIIEKPKEGQIFPVHLLCLFLLFSPLFYEVVFYGLFGRG